jgi:ribosomal protein S8
MNFKKDRYTVIKNAITKELASFCYDYFLLKRKVADTLLKTGYIASFNSDWGSWNDPQVINTYSHYSDIAMETLLLKVKPIMEKNTKLKLIETYSYARIYKKGDILEKHKDRPSCEISTTLNLGGDVWPIFIEPDFKKGTDTGNNYVPSDSKGIKVNLNPGDMLVYRGCDLEHWRNKFEGENCGQVFLHYNDSKSKLNTDNIFDSRPHLGLPNWFKGRKI